MNEDPSPWPERRRTQRLLFVAGGLLLVPVVAALGDAVDLGGAVVVGLATVAAALLVYGLLGWAGRWVDPDRAPAGPDAGGETGREGGAGAETGRTGDGTDPGGNDDETGAEGGGDGDASAGGSDGER